MAYRSPYRGDDRLSPRTRELISRGTLLAIGVLLAYFSLRAGLRLHELYTTGPQPLFFRHGYRGRHTLNPVVVWPWAVVIVCGLLSLTMVFAASLRVGAMQRLFERFGRPPTTGDRDLDDDRWHWRWWPW